MKRLICAVSLVLSGACAAHAKGSNNPISVLDWFDGCSLLTQPKNGMIMDTNCVSTAVDYCTTGRMASERVQCLVTLSEHVGELSTEIESKLPKSIGEVGRAARSYERMYIQLTEKVFDVCDASPSEEIPPKTWCDMYLNAGRWVQWRQLQRLVDEVAQ